MWCCAMATASFSCAARAPAATSASTSAVRSASAATSIRRTATSPAACSANGARRSRPTSCPNFEPIGVLNDDDNAVGAVHLGLVFVAQADGRPVAIRERDKLEGRFASWRRGRCGRRQARDVERLLFDFLAETASGRIIVR